MRQLCQQLSSWRSSGQRLAHSIKAMLLAPYLVRCPQRSPYCLSIPTSTIDRTLSTNPSVTFIASMAHPRSQNSADIDLEQRSQRTRTSWLPRFKRNRQSRIDTTTQEPPKKGTVIEVTT